jgi:hypothetical protein
VCPWRECFVTGSFSLFCVSCLPVRWTALLHHSLSTMMHCLTPDWNHEQNQMTTGQTSETMSPNKPLLFLSQFFSGIFVTAMKSWLTQPTFHSFTFIFVFSENFIYLNFRELNTWHLPKEFYSSLFDFLYLPGMSRRNTFICLLFGHCARHSAGP